MQEKKALVRHRGHIFHPRPYFTCTPSTQPPAKSAHKIKLSSCQYPVELEKKEQKPKQSAEIQLLPWLSARGAQRVLLAAKPLNKNIGDELLPWFWLRESALQPSFVRLKILFDQAARSDQIILILATINQHRVCAQDNLNFWSCYVCYKDRFDPNTRWLSFRDRLFSLVRSMEPMAEN